jgi:GT2 family glycosyltransferase
LGVKHAKGELVTFIDDDAEAPENWLQNIYSTFKQYPSLVCLGGPHSTPPEESQESPLRFVEGSFLESHMQRTYLDRSAIGKIAGCNVTYKKAIFDKIGYLNETWRSGEDWEFHRRLLEKGYNMRFDPQISVWHHRQGLKHVFQNSAKMMPFYLSWKTFKYSKYESLFATYYYQLLCLSSCSFLQSSSLFPCCLSC